MNLVCTISVVVLLVVSCVVAAPVNNETIPFQYPLFKQCGQSWSDDLMVNQTICSVGCLMSSVSMALRGKGIQIGGKDSDPGVLNAWLKQNGGYDQYSGLYEEVVPKIAPTLIQYVGPYYGNTSLSAYTLKQMLQKGIVVIANVMHGHHFVLMVGFDTGNVNWYVNDPGFETTVYTYSDIVGYRVFQMQTPH